MYEYEEAGETGFPEESASQVDLAVWYNGLFKEEQERGEVGCMGECRDAASRFTSMRVLFRPIPQQR